MELIKRPLAVSLTGTIIWIFARNSGFLTALSANDEMALTALITTLGLIYWLVAASALATTWAEWSQTEDAALKGDAKRFWQLADRRIPKPLKSVLFITSLLLWLSFIFMPFNALPAGIFAIFAVALVLAMVWEVIIDLENPLDGMWKVKNPPPRG